MPAILERLSVAGSSKSPDSCLTLLAACPGKLPAVIPAGPEVAQQLWKVVQELYLCSKLASEA